MKLSSFEQISQLDEIFNDKEPSTLATAGRHKKISVKIFCLKLRRASETST